MSKKELAEQILALLEKSNMKLSDIKFTLDWVQRDIAARAEYSINQRRLDTLPLSGCPDLPNGYQLLYKQILNT